MWQKLKLMSLKHFSSSVKWTFSLLILIPSALFCQSKIIWTDLAGNISRANVDGSKIETILSRHIPIDMLALENQQKLLWTESGSNSLWQIGVNGSTPELLYKGKDKLQGLAIDQNKLYVIQGSTVIKMNLDGTAIETVVTNATDALDIVVIDGLVYWSTSSGGLIVKQNANGNGGRMVLENLANPNNLIYNPSEKKLYWREYCGASVCSGVRKANPDGSSKTIVINEFVGGFTFSADGNKLYCTYDIFDQVFSINTDGSGRVKLADITSSPTGINLLGGKLFWFDLAYGDYLYSAALNGSSQKALATTPVYQPTRFVIDTLDKWIYWINQHSNFSSDRAASTSIRRAKLDGSQQQVIIPSSTARSPFGLAIDFSNKKLYWTDSGQSGIFRSNLDGTATSKVVSGAQNPYDLLLDVEKGFLYWSDWGARKVMRANLDGSKQKTLAQNLNTPLGLALDRKGNFLYFGEGSNPKIKRVPIDSGKVDTVLLRPSASDRVQGLWIDNNKGQLYWTDDASRIIYRANLDGSSITKILDQSHGLRTPYGIQVFNSSFIVSTRNLDRTAELKVYPNPFNSSFQVEGLKIGDQLELYDQLGHRSWQQKITLDGTNRIDCQGLPFGIYFLSVIHTNGQISVMKLLKHSNE